MLYQFGREIQLFDGFSHGQLAETVLNYLCSFGCGINLTDLVIRSNNQNNRLVVQRLLELAPGNTWQLEIIVAKAFQLIWSVFSSKPVDQNILLAFVLVSILV